MSKLKRVILSVFNMNKKAEMGEQIFSIVVYLLLTLIFLSGAFYFVYSYTNGAAVWEDFYAKEISRVINLANPREQIVLDFQKATIIAKRNNVDSKDIVSIVEDKKEACVKLNIGRKSCYSYFNEIKVIAWKVELGVPENVLKINIGDKNG